VPDDDVNRFINDLVRAVSTYLYGRRMYEMMIPCETDPNLAATPSSMGDFAQIWQTAEKILYSKILETVPTRKTRIKRDFDPEAIRQLKTTAGQEILVGDSNLTAHTFKVELIDEC
jgi:hypothetical protein